MDADTIISTFGLNQGTAVSKTRVPKARFLELPDVLAPNRKLLTDEVGGVTLLAVFNEDTTGIQATKTKEVVYEEVYFFHVTLKKDNHIAELNQLLQSHITNPAIIFYTLDEAIAISTAPKRLSKQVAGKTVAEDVYLTPWLHITHITDDEYLQEGEITKGSFTHLERLYQDFTNYVRHAELLPLVASLTVDRRRDWSKLEPSLGRFRELTSELRRLSEEERKQAGFGDKLAFRSKQVKLDKERTQILAIIRTTLENKS